MATVFRPGLFAGKVAIVTGGGTGIGRAISQELVELGADVTVAARREAPLRDTASALTAAGPGRCHHTVCDVRNQQQVTALVESVVERHGQIDLLVNNGGGQFMSPAADIRPKGWDAVISTNLTGTFTLCQTAYNLWFKQHGGVIVNILADMFRGFPYMAHTGASRAAVENLTRTLAVEWAQDGVRVNAVAPGMVYSVTAAQNYPIDVFAKYASHTPAHRCASTHEVASAVCFLLSPGASYISGATLRVDCGSSLYSPQLHRVPAHSRLPPHRGDPGRPVADAGVPENGAVGSETAGGRSACAGSDARSPVRRGVGSDSGGQRERSGSCTAEPLAKL